MRKSVVNDPEVVQDILSRADVLWLALTDKDGPYSVPVNFAVEDDVIYIHSGIKGRKQAALSTGAPLSFSAAVDMQLRTGNNACAYGYLFRSVVGFGTPRVLEGDDTRHALDVITSKYAGELLPYEQKAMTATKAYAIDITSITARIKE